jgi:pectate lyase
MKRIVLSIIVLAIGLSVTFSLAANSVIAFPGAEGFGALATGGNGGEVYHVTNLGDSGPGTFRDAVSQPDRTILFNVGGTIHLQSNVTASSDLTILGQTAPGDGITLYGRSISFSGCTNIIVRYLRIREGIAGDRGKCSINIVDGGNMIFDHVSVEWGRWDCLGLTHGSRDITFQYCLLGQGIDPQRFGALVDTVTNVTFSHNLWIDNESRNPKAKGTIQYINNVVYNWGVNGLVGGHSEADHELDVIGNYFIKGPSSNGHFVGLFSSTDHVCQKDNYVDLNPGGHPGGHLVTNDEFRAAGGAAVFVATPFLQPAVPVTVDSPKTALEKAIADAGCSLHRDAVDQSLIAELKSFGKAGHIITDESGHGIQAAAR